MTSENPTNPNDPQQPYEPPAGGYQPPASGGYQPPAQQPGGYQPPAAQPGSYQPPAQQAYEPPAQQPYQAPGAQYQQPAQDAASYGAPYGQQVPQTYPGTPYPPVPATGQLATWGTRALGGLIDYVIPGIILGGISSIWAPNPSTGVSSNQLMYTLFNTILPIVWWVYNSGWKQGTTGQTFGKQLAKTKLVSEATGQPIGFLMAVVRHLAHIIDTIICFVGWLFPLWDAKRQTIADKIMKTVVIRTN